MDYKKISKKINHTLESWSEFDNIYEALMLVEKRPGLFNGYRIPNLEKINNMVLYFAQKSKTI